MIYPVVFLRLIIVKKSKTYFSSNNMQLDKQSALPALSASTGTEG